MKNDFVSKGRSVSDLKAHLVLTTKYRRKAFTGEMLTRLHEIFAALLVKWDCKIVEFNGEADHVHLLFQYHPDLQLSILVNNLKSVSSRKLRSEFAEHLAAFCGAPRSGSPTMRAQQDNWKDVFWNGSYFIASCGGVTISTLKQYIEEQNTPE
jgi:putative transposase